MEQTEKKKVGRPTKKDSARRYEEKKMKEALFKVLREDVLLSEEKAMDLTEKYVKLGDFAKAVRSGEDMDITDDNVKEKINMVARSW